MYVHLRMRVWIIRHARNHSVGKYQSCMFENVGLSVHSALGVGVVLHTSGPVLESGRVERAEGVGHNRRLLLVNLVQKRGEDPPRLHIHSHIRVRLKIIRNLETMHD